MTKRALIKLCAVWQERLLLQSWVISSVVLDKAMETWGLVEFDRQYLAAKIKLHPDGPEGVEFYLVHELLHLRLCAWQGSTAELESAINLLTRAFIKAHSRKRKSVNAS